LAAAGTRRYVNQVTLLVEADVPVEPMLLVAAVVMVLMLAANVWVLEVLLLPLVRRPVPMPVQLVIPAIVLLVLRAFLCNENYRSIHSKDIVYNFLKFSFCPRIWKVSSDTGRRNS
jgi:hypothetical protein